MLGVCDALQEFILGKEIFNTNLYSQTLGKWMVGAWLKPSQEFDDSMNLTIVLLIVIGLRMDEI